MAKTRSIGQVLNNTHAGLANVILRSKELHKLSTSLKNLVDAPLSEHIYVANVRDATLVIGTDSAVWYTRIKYLGPMILTQMQQIPGLEKLQKIEFRIQPFGASASTNGSSENHPPSAPPSRPTQEGFRQPNDYALKQALQKISKKIVK